MSLVACGDMRSCFVINVFVYNITDVGDRGHTSGEMQAISAPENSKFDHQPRISQTSRKLRPWNKHTTTIFQKFKRNISFQHFSINVQGFPTAYNCLQLLPATSPKTWLFNILGLIWRLCLGLIWAPLGFPWVSRNLLRGDMSGFTLRNIWFQIRADPKPWTCDVQTLDLLY